MNEQTYDVVTVGGGLGGAVLARTMAAAGAWVLVLERTTEFVDRVRGEVLVPWGCKDAQKLGLWTALRNACGHDLLWWDVEMYGAPVVHRDMAATTLPGLATMTFFHPEMQRLVLQEAIDAGAKVQRGAVVTNVRPGEAPTVEFTQEGQTREVRARLVVGADGRNSRLRTWGGFATSEDPQRRVFAGVLLDGVRGAEDTMTSRFAPAEGLMSWIFPQGGGRVRAYIGSPAQSDMKPLSGKGQLANFFKMAHKLGVPEEEFAEAKAAGPLASFDATDCWVEHPYRDGVALIGDAAVMSDPTWGQGMAYTLRDVRGLSERLLAEEDWDAAGHAYAESHDVMYTAVHTCDTWYTDVLLDTGPEADALRARALPLILEDPTRMPDSPLSGPEWPVNEAARRRFFGEDG